MRATENIQLETVNSYVLESIEQAKKSTMLCDLNKRLATKVKALETAEPIQGGLSKELEAAHQQMEVLEAEVCIEKHGPPKVKWRLDKFKSELEATMQTYIELLPLEKDLLQHQESYLCAQ